MNLHYVAESKKCFIFNSTPLKEPKVIDGKVLLVLGCCVLVQIFIFSADRYNLTTNFFFFFKLCIIKLNKHKAAQIKYKVYNYLIKMNKIFISFSLCWAAWQVK